MPTKLQLSHNLWLEYPRFLRDVPRRLLVPVLSMAIYGLGLLAALVGHAGSSYLRSSSFAIGSVGIAWVFTSIRERARIGDDIYVQLGHAFTASATLYTTLITSHFQAICNWRRHLQLGAVIAVTRRHCCLASFLFIPLSDIPTTAAFAAAMGFRSRLV